VWATVVSRWIGARHQTRLRSGIHKGGWQAQGVLALPKCRSRMQLYSQCEGPSRPASGSVLETGAGRLEGDGYSSEGSREPVRRRWPGPTIQSRQVQDWSRSSSRPITTVDAHLSEKILDRVQPALHALVLLRHLDILFRDAPESGHMSGQVDLGATARHDAPTSLLAAITADYHTLHSQLATLLLSEFQQEANYFWRRHHRIPDMAAVPHRHTSSLMNTGVSTSTSTSIPNPSRPSPPALPLHGDPLVFLHSTQATGATGLAPELSLLCRFSGRVAPPSPSPSPGFW
jgi:hypothetical protein